MTNGNLVITNGTVKISDFYYLKWINLMMKFIDAFDIEHSSCLILDVR